jgi:AraC family transcriptional activator FtrA
MHKVAILSYNNLSLFEFACAVEIFALPRPEFESWYDCDVIAFDQGPHLSTGGIQIQAKPIENLSEYDTLVIPSWPTHISCIKGEPANQIKQFYLDGKRILSFCSGAFLLATLGILDNHNATTHWKYAGHFKKSFPQVNYLGDVLYTFDGQIGCSAGSAAALDLGLEIVRQDFGNMSANHVARCLLVAPHRNGGQSQFEEFPLTQIPTQFSNTVQWAIDNIDENITIDHLADHANMSRRTFDRKFRNSFRTTPKRWLTEQRLDKAKTMLADEQLNIEQIAERCGFDNSTTMRHHFRQLIGMSPRQYRDQFSIN